MHNSPILCAHQSRFATKNNDTRGVSVLLAVIILGSALLIIAVGGLLGGLQEQESGYAKSRGGEARALADGCMNEALLRIRRDSAWGLLGTVPFTAPNGSCSIQVNDLGGQTRRIDVTATVSEYSSHIRTDFSLASTPPTIITWEERTD